MRIDSGMPVDDTNREVDALPAPPDRDAILGCGHEGAEHWSFAHAQKSHTIMKTGPLLQFMLLAAASPCIWAQNPQPCTSPEARAFDFWIGNWRIEQHILQQDETWLALKAKTSVLPALEGCALIEHWEGKVQFFWEGMQQPERMTGLSVRAYDPQTEKWYIHWMNTRTPHFGGAYAGNFKDGRGTFTREWETPQGKRLGRITFSEIMPQSVTWELAVSGDDGQDWTTLWIMKMERFEP